MTIDKKNRYSIFEYVNNGKAIKIEEPKGQRPTEYSKGALIFKKAD
jgi:hypothetical protein